MPRNIVEIRPKFGEKTEYFAIYWPYVNESLEGNNEATETIGPYTSIGELESNLPEGEYTIVTKVKRVRLER